MKPGNIALNDGNAIPLVGLGVWQISDEQAVNVVSQALENGYRHIDTAAIYRNETGVGRALKQSTIPRQDIFLTSKIWNSDVREGRTTEALDQSLSRLQTDYLDLCLLHWPVNGRIDAWQALEAARKAGKVRSIGVSNFTAVHLDELVKQTSVVPCLNQIEHHPYLTQSGITQACQQHQIAVEAWSPLMQGKFRQEPMLEELAMQVGKTAAQVILRWAIQRNIIVIPKTVSVSRMRENMALFDFELSSEAIGKIDGLERNQRLGPDPYNFDF